jgi:Flp pilus assembly protein TadD
MARHVLLLAVCFSLSLASLASAQPGRVGGVVRDEDGNPIKGATVMADNPNIGTSSFTATTDDRGRFSMIGLRPGTWRFIAQAPGHSPSALEVPVRSVGTANAPMLFMLRKSGLIMGPLGGLAARDLQADLAKADALFNEKKWDESIAAYRAILSRAAPLTVIHLQIASAYRAKKDYDGAIGAYKSLLDAEPGREEAVVGTAATQLEKGDAKAAEATLVEAAGKDEPGKGVYFSLAQLRASQGQAEEAAKWYAKASTADPAWGKPLYQLARLSLDRGDKAAAAKYLGEVVAVDPTSAEASEARAELDRLK